MMPDEATMKKILRDVESEFQMGGLSSGLYADYATEVAKRAITAASPETAMRFDRNSVIEECASICDGVSSSQGACAESCLRDGMKMAGTTFNGGRSAAGTCAAAIRALKVSEPQSDI